MYSSSPHMIKHFIPLNFSKQTLDYSESPKKKIQPLDQNPFHNKKLRINIQNKPKDCILTFTNRSSKSFAPKKNIQYISLLKNMIMSHKKSILIEQTQRNTYNLQLQRNPLRPFSYEKPSTSKTKRSISSPYTNSKSSTPFLSIRRPLSKQIVRQRNQPNYNIQTYNNPFEFLKITGNRAPKSQMVDHWKKNSSSSIQILKK